MNLADAKQTITGFGCAPGNAEQISMSSVQADQLFTGAGIWLTVGRTRIGSYGANNSSTSQGFFGSAGTLGDSATSLNNYRMAQSRGASLFVVNLSCPASMKTPANTVGGTVSNASACAAYYVSALQDAQIVGVNITAVEWQNEPNASVSYESTTMSAAQLVSFIDTAGPIVKAAFPSMKFYAASSQDWQNTWGGTGYVPAILADGTAPTYVDAISVHTYGSPDVSSAPGSTGGRNVLVTEMSGLTGPQDATMTHAMVVAGWLFDSLGTGQASAWIWWQFQNFPGDTTNQGLYLNDGTITKRLFVLGNYSKFVRPGMIAYGFTGSAPSGVNVLMFKHPTTNDVAVVATNTNGTTTSLTVTLDAASKCKVAVPVVTDASNNLGVQTPIVLSGGSFTYPLSATSVTSFACNGSL